MKHDRAVMSFDDLLCDPKTETSPDIFLRSKKRLENSLGDIGRYAWTVVLQHEHNLLTGYIRSTGQMNIAPFRCGIASLPPQRQRGCPCAGRELARE